MNIYIYEYEYDISFTTRMIIYIKEEYDESTGCK